MPLAHHSEEVLYLLLSGLGLETGTRQYLEGNYHVPSIELFISLFRVRVLPSIGCSHKSATRSVM